MTLATIKALGMIGKAIAVVLVILMVAVVVRVMTGGAQ